MDRSFSQKIITAFFLILALIAVTVILYLLRDLFMLFFLAFIFASALDGPITRLTKLKVPRPAAIALAYVLILGLLVVLLGVALPPLIRQTAQLLAALSKVLGVSDYHLDQLTTVDFSIVASSFDQYLARYQSLFGQLQGSLNTITNIIFSTFSAVSCSLPS